MFVLSLHISEIWEGARGVLAAKSGEGLRRREPCFSYVTMVTFFFENLLNVFELCV